jgi:hypothetical protein
LFIPNDKETNAANPAKVISKISYATTILDELKFEAIYIKSKISLYGLFRGEISNFYLAKFDLSSKPSLSFKIYFPGCAITSASN